MSRKSKRRRGMQGQPAPDGFEFTDDRSQRATVAPMPASPLPGHDAATDAAKTAKATHATKPAKPAKSDPAADASSAVATAVVPDDAADATASATPSASASEAAKPAPTKPAPAPKPAVVEPTIGELLARARQSRRLSLEAASARTRIPVKMLDHLEHDRFDEFAAPAYARGSLRAYGVFLGLDAGALVQRFDDLMAPVLATEETEASTDPTVEVEAEPTDTAARPSVKSVKSVKSGKSGKSGSRRAALLALLGGIAAAGIGWGIYAFATRNPVELRPRAQLNQIEDELRRSQSATTAPTPATSIVPSTPAEDTAAPAPGPTPSAAPAPTPPAATRSDAEITKPAPSTDLVAAPAPQPPAGMAPSVSTPAAPARVPIVIPAGALVLQATALGPCAVRVQIDNDIAGATLHQFAAGETYTWAARRSFRLTPQRGVNLQLVLDGKPVVTPADGQSIRLDRGVAEPPAPTSRRRRGRTRAAGNRNAPASEPAPVMEPHGGVPPPR